MGEEFATEEEAFKNKTLRFTNNNFGIAAKTTNGGDDHHYGL